jgi:hypothetical protein
MNDINVENSKIVLEILKNKSKSFGTTIETIKRVFVNSAESHSNLADCFLSVNNFFENRRFDLNLGKISNINFLPSGNKIQEIKAEISGYGLDSNLDPKNLYISTTDKFSYYIQF